MKEARKHLQRCCFPRPVRPKETNQFTLLNREADVADGMNVPVLAREKPFESSSQAGVLVGETRKVLVRLRTSIRII